jgi:hypothetical protein
VGTGGTGFYRWNLTNATVSLGDWLGVGVPAGYNNAARRGYVYQTGGTVNVSTNTANGGLKIAGLADPTALGVYEISGGGTLSLKGSQSDFWIGNSAVSNAEFHVSGSANTIEVADEFVGRGHTNDVTKVLMRFTADAGGVSPIACGGNVKLAENGYGIALNVDVSLCKRKGQIGLELFSYTSSLSDTFGATNVVDDSLGALTPGAQGSLTLGEYAIDYGSGSGDAITLYYHNTPPPGTVLSIR